MYSGLESAYKVSGYDPKFRVRHFEGKARVSGKPNHHLLMRNHSKRIPRIHGGLPRQWLGPSLTATHTLKPCLKVFAPKPIEDNGIGFFCSTWHRRNANDLPRGPSSLRPLGQSGPCQAPGRSNGLRLSIATAHMIGQDMVGTFTAVTD